MAVASAEAGGALFLVMDTPKEGNSWSGSWRQFPGLRVQVCTGRGLSAGSASLLRSLMPWAGWTPFYRAGPALQFWAPWDALTSMPPPPPFPSSVSLQAGTMHSGKASRPETS